MFRAPHALSNKNGAEATRRWVHFSFGLVAFLVPAIGRPGSLALAAAAIAYNLWLAPRLRLDARYRREGERRLGGLVTYPIAVFLLLLPPIPLPVGCGAWAVLAAGDPCAAWAGSKIGVPKIPWNRGKTLAGTLAGFAAATAFAALLLLSMGSPRPLAAAAAAGAAGLLAESVRWPVDDNLAVAAAAALALLPFHA